LYQIALLLQRPRQLALENLAYSEGKPDSCRAQERDPPPFLLSGAVKDSVRPRTKGGVCMIRWAAKAIAAWFTSRADLIAENLCLRQQLIVLQRRTPRPRLRAGDLKGTQTRVHAAAW